MNKIDVLVGKRIRARRHAMGISQTELGDAIGVKFQQIQKYETGANRVSASRLWAVAEKLGVDVVYFFEGIKRSDDAADIAGSPIDKMEFLSDRDAIEMMELYRKLPTSQRSAVLAFMRSMALDAGNNLSVANS
ncbi:helix-turn-helix domain-containing protein [Cognatishimia activa]|uniref:Transcriptional repressor DicA n=1 Tax=Cognatishimia activa TaxID=1715691 RepID=A0A0P1ITF7_9RHOB|nr:helix-turn-helix transcriptional regulator [Cognatishimia activa]MEE2945577.1 helix-turn-helix transcriptional regulator [Pseudomonadota bacterium]CUI80759.1 transcriptional repressor DicA [Cognatishimia activa]CUK26885.1 transcriptional repressor DicA [Cognatishimia activa]